MRLTKTIMTLLVSVGILVCVSACGKRGDPVRPSDVVQTQAS